MTSALPALCLLPLFALLALGAILVPLAMTFAERRRARFRRRLEDAYTRFGAGAVACPTCRPVACACPAG